MHALVIAFGKVCQSSLILLTWKPGWTCTRLFHKFLNDSGELEAECINRLNAGKGKGFEIPVDYRLVAKDFSVGRLKRKLSKKDFVDDINISKIQQITVSSMR